MKFSNSLHISRRSIRSEPCWPKWHNLFLSEDFGWIMKFPSLRLIVTGEFIFSSSYDKTIKAWVFDTTTIGPGQESESCIRTFKGHGKGVYPLIFIPAEDFDLSDGATFNPGDTIISGSADQTARTWSCDTGACLKVRIAINTRGLS